MTQGGDWTLCIDFGTAFSKAAAAPIDAWSSFDPAWVRPLLLAGDEANQNRFLLESAVFVGDDRVVFGASAVASARALARERRVALRSFKTLLSVSDLDRALNTSAPAAVDPHRIFTMRDLVTLYLAYLLASIEHAISLDAELAEADIGERRYAAPAWRSGDSAGLHSAVVALFAEAEALAARLGARLLAPEGLSIVDVEKALSAPATMAHADMGLIFEASAAAAYTSIGLERSAAHMVVVDIGAGTTDIAALFRSGARVRELPQARITLRQAGDFLDHVIANLAIAAAGASMQTSDEQTPFWNLLIAQMGEIKESIFLDGRAVLRHRNRTHVIKRRDLERDKDYRAFVSDLSHAFEHSLKIARRHAQAESRREIQVIAVGGGSAAPFVHDMLTRASSSGAVKVIPRPATPQWAYEVFDGNLAPVFPQLAIAIGGALAPREMLAAGGSD